MSAKKQALNQVSGRRIGTITAEVENQDSSNSKDRIPGNNEGARIIVMLLPLTVMPTFISRSGERRKKY